MDGYNLSMSDRIEENPRYKLYVWLCNKINGEKDIVEGNNIFISQRLDERWGLFRGKMKIIEGGNMLQRRRGRIFW